MSNETSSIDDLLTATQSRSQPAAPESNHLDIPQEAQNTPDESYAQQEEAVSSGNNDYSEAEAAESQPEAVELDDYGNERAPSKMFSEDEVNDRINRAVRERLERIDRNQGNIPPQNAQNVQNQPLNSSDNQNGGDWQQELQSFVEQTVTTMSQRQMQEEQRRREQYAEAEFQTKFQEGMRRFPDFQDVVSKQPFTDAMTHALKAFDDPSAFAIAAAKRAPKELERIAGYRDPIKQMVELGKLEEKMRQNKPTTKTPKPLTKVQEDGSIPHKNTREPSIEELIARDAQKRKALQDSRRRR